MSQPTAVVGGDVQGDITSCKIENQKYSVQKSSAWSFTQTSSYITYDVCNKKTLTQFKVNEFADFGIVVLLIVGLLILGAAGAAFMRWSMDW